MAKSLYAQFTQEILGTMEQIVNIHIKKLPEGVFLATSKDVPGLVAQGRTVTEALEIARDVARKLMEARAERQGKVKLKEISDSFDYPLIVSG
jgi:predicted RNase H-like HicB family nuclease